MQARSLDPVAHPRAIQPLDQNTEVRLKDNYYVVSHRDKSVKKCDNLLLLLFIWDISGHVSKSYYFQRVTATHNIMHESWNITNAAIFGVLSIYHNLAIKMQAQNIVACFFY